MGRRRRGHGRVLDAYVELVNASLTRQVYAVTQSPTGEIQERSFRLVLPSIGVRGEF